MYKMEEKKPEPLLNTERWRKLKAAVANKRWLDDYEKLKHVEIRKLRRGKKLTGFNGLSNLVLPCLIRRPSIILPEDEERIKKISTKPENDRKNSTSGQELSDVEDDAPETNDTDRLTSSQDKYIRACRKFKITPITTFYKQLTENSIILKHHHFTPDEFKACALALTCNPTVTNLDIEGGHIGPEGVAYLSNIIYDYDILIKLNLTKNNIGPRGFVALDYAMDKNLHLQELNLSDNNIGDKNCNIIRQILAGDNLLKSLNLSNNNIGDIGANYIAHGLVKNDELKILNLSWNKIASRGASALAFGLSKNTDLHGLNLSWNALEEGGAHALGLSLEQNSSLKELDLSSNRINQSGLAKVLKGLKLNSTLESFTLADNPITAAGALVALTISEEHESLKFLDFGNQPVSEEFERKLSDIRKKKRVHVRFGKIMSSKRREKEGDDTIFVKGDPRLILLEYTRIKKIHILDIFKSFDLDGSHSITWEEFRQGIKNHQLPIRASDIEILIQAVDINLDGKVDFSELIISQKSHKKRVETLKAKGDDAFKNSNIGLINGELRKWFAERLKDT